MIQAILFDFNGVIIDDERIHLKAYREVFVAEGVTLTDEEYLLCLGMDDAAFVRAAFARAGRELTDDAMRAVINREHELHRALIKAELPVSQLRCWYHIAEHEGLKMQEVSNALGIKLPALSQMVERGDFGKAARTLA